MASYSDTYTLAFVVAYALVGGGLLFQAARVHRAARSEPSRPAAVIFLIALAFWVSLHAVEPMSPHFSVKYGTLVVRYIFLASVPALWFFWAHLFARPDERIARGVAVALAICSIGFFGLVLTNPWHHLVWSTVDYVAPDRRLEKSYGPLFWYFIAYVVAVFVSNGVVIFRNLARRRMAFGWEVSVLAGFVILPLIVILLDVRQTDGGPDMAVSPLIVGGFAITFAHTVLRFRERLLSPASWGHVTQHIADPILIADEAGTLVSYNEAARRVIPSLRSGIRMTDLARMGGLASFEDQPQEELFTVESDDGRRSFSYELMDVTDWRDQRIGRALLLRDVTFLLRREDQLRQTQTQLERAQAITRVSFWNWDLRTGELEASPGGDDVLGSELARRAGSLDAYLEYVHAEDRKVVAAFARQLSRGGAERIIQYRVVDERGEMRYIEARAELTLDEQGVPVRAFGTIQNVTEREMQIQAREEALAQKNEMDRKFRLIAENTSDVIWTVDLKLELTYVSPSVEKTLGFTPEEYMALPATQRLSQNSLRFVAEELLSERVREEAGELEPGYFRTVELELLCKDGSTRWCEATASAVRDDAGVPIGIVGVTRDISERKRAEETRAHLERQLWQAQKMESLALMAGGIAHDFNNRLMSVVALLSMARLKAERDSEILARLEKAEDACISASQLARKLLTFSRGGAPERRPCSVRTLLERARDLNLVGSSTLFSIELPDDLPCVDVDEDQTLQVFGNLLINAKEAMNGGGRITVRGSVEPLPESANYEPTSQRHVHLVFTDTGPGIGSDHLGHVFDPFYTTKTEGSGLGLSTSYAIVKNHGGHLNISNGSQGGAVVDLYLPATSALAEISGPVEAEPVSGSGRVLLLEDENSIAELVVEFLDTQGYACDVAADGQKAITMWKEAMRSERPYALALLDLTIRGGKGGRETIIELRSIDPAVQAIATSGYSDDDVISHYTEHGFCASLRKPFKLDELSAVIASVLNGSDSENPEPRHRAIRGADVRSRD